MHRILRLALSDDKYKRVNTNSPFFRDILQSQPLASLFFAAAGFSFDHGTYDFYISPRDVCLFI